MGRKHARPLPPPPEPAWKRRLRQWWHRRFGHGAVQRVVKSGTRRAGEPWPPGQGVVEQYCRADCFDAYNRRHDPRYHAKQMMRRAIAERDGDA